MNIYQMPENKLKQLIAIAAQQAGYDTTDKDPQCEYRQLVLKHLTGKTTTSDMGKPRLIKVLQWFMDNGFKVSARGKAKTNPDWLKKLISLWKTMYTQGFIREPGFQALEQWAKSQLQHNIEGDVPAKLDWMGKYSHLLIEGLKAYHHRVMKAVIQERYEYLMDNVFKYYKHEFTTHDCTSLQFLSELLPLAQRNYSNCDKAFDIITRLIRLYDQKAVEHE